MKSKRFIDQVIDRQTWRRLTPDLKVTWIYLWMNCDEAGVYEVDGDLFEFENGFQLDLQLLRDKLGEFLEFSGNLILIKKFMFVNNGTLQKNYNPHKPVWRAISKHNLILNSSLNEAWFKLGDGDGDGDGEGDGDEVKERPEIKKKATAAVEKKLDHVQDIPVDVNRSPGIIRRPEIPDLDEFLSYAKNCIPDVDPADVRAKYMAWKADGWRSMDKDIRNWRSKLAHTVIHLGRIKKKDAPPGVGNHAQDLSELIAIAEKQADI